MTPFDPPIFTEIVSMMSAAGATAYNVHLLLANSRRAEPTGLMTFVASALFGFTVSLFVFRAVLMAKIIFTTP
jgi:hypothetical protein